MPPSGTVTIEPWSAASADLHRAADIGDVDRIFFQSSGTQSFASEAARRDFRTRWLGRYLDCPADLCFVARGAEGPIAQIIPAQGGAAQAGTRPAGAKQDGAWQGETAQDGATQPTLEAGDFGAGAIVGYVIGALSDPARDSRFDDIAYFKELHLLTARYPAHLHINCAPAWRGHGIGARLIEAFCAAARDRGAAGVHVVTGEGLRNTRFYARNGFRQQGQAASNGKPVVFLARSLAP